MKSLRIYILSNLIPAVCLLLVSSIPISAEMLQLSAFQTGTFHIAQQYTEVTSDRFKDDKYIDDDQAEQFVKASEVEIYLPADRDNYPYTLIDYYTSDTDLVVAYSKYHASILCAYPPTRFINRHNISRTDYTDEKLPPEIYMTAVTAPEPFHYQRVKATSTTLRNYHVHQDEYFTQSVSPGEEHLYSGHLVNGDVYASGCISVWVRQGAPFPADHEYQKSEKNIKISCPNCQ